MTGIPFTKFMQLKGDFALKTVEKCERIYKYQRKNGISSGIRGFLFYGEPGTGKTTVAYSIAAKINSDYTQKDKDKNLVAYDCADFASHKYGETESRIKKAFEDGISDGFPVILFDDVDGLFLTRSFGSKLDAWYLSHINVLFHELDNLDTSQTIVIMTTNRIDLVDDALRDRLIEIEFPFPTRKTLRDYLENKCFSYRMPESLVAIILSEFDSTDDLDSFRSTEKWLMTKYIEHMLKSEE